MPRSSSTTRPRPSRSAPPALDAGVIEVDGFLWKAKPGTEVSADEFVAARATMIEIHRDARWNPWVEQDRAEELEQAKAKFDTWMRAEPDHRVMTRAEMVARFPRWDAEWEQEWKETCARREARKGEYDEGRAHARLALLEQEAYLSIAKQRRARLVGRELYPGMDEARRDKAVAEQDENISRGLEAVESWHLQVGDPELDGQAGAGTGLPEQARGALAQVRLRLNPPASAPTARLPR